MSEDEVRRHLAELAPLLRAAQQIEGADVNVVDGVIMMSPASAEHSKSYNQLVLQYTPQIDDSLEILGDVRFVHPAWPTERYPDFVVWRPSRPDEGGARDASRILFACEIVSESSVENDYAGKPREYRLAGIDAYLILDPYTREYLLRTDPGRESWRSRRSGAYGPTLTVPLPDGPTLVLDTGKLPAAPEHKQVSAWPRHRAPLLHEIAD